jgi:hypothetical protein
MLSRILLALGIAAAASSFAAVAFLRTDFVANNLCAYAVATIEEATAAQVKVARCSVQPRERSPSRACRRATPAAASGSPPTASSRR